MLSVSAESAGTAEVEVISLVIDSNAGTSIYGIKNAVTTLLTNAINKHNSGQKALYYINRKEAAKLYQPLAELAGIYVEIV